MIKIKFKEKKKKETKKKNGRPTTYNKKKMNYGNLA